MLTSSDDQFNSEIQLLHPIEKSNNNWSCCTSYLWKSETSSFRLPIVILILFMSLLIFVSYRWHPFQYSSVSRLNGMTTRPISTHTQLKYSVSYQTKSYEEKSRCLNKIDNSTFPFINVTRNYPSYWEKNDIVLVVHFNHNYYNRIDFLMVYFKVFPVVLFTGPAPHPHVIYCPEGQTGHQAYSCLARAIARCPNHAGYLMCHFDLIPIFYNLETLNLNNIWLPEIYLYQESETNGWHWVADIGKKAFLSCLLDLQQFSTNSSQYLKYLTNYQNRTQYKYPSSFSDIFYLPQRFVEDWFAVSELMLKRKLFLEIGFPFATLMISSTNDTSILRGENWNVRSPNDTIHLYPTIHYYHRINHVFTSHQSFIAFIVNRSISS